MVSRREAVAIISALMLSVAGCNRWRPQQRTPDPQAKAQTMKIGESIQAGVKEEPPVEAAVIVHQEDSDRVMIVDLRTQKAHPVGTATGAPEEPAWSPDGEFLVYRDGHKLMLHVSDGNSPDKSLLDNLFAETYTPYAFSPDSRLLAVSTTHGPVIVPIHDLAGQMGSQPISIPQGCKVVDLLWAANGRSLWILCYPAPGRDESELLAIDPLTRHFQSRPAHQAKRLLGWKAGTDILLVSRGEEEGEVAGTLAASGDFHKLTMMNAEGDEHQSEYILEYIQSSETLVTVAASEDQGDPVSLRLESESKPAQPWLSSFPRLSDLSISADGKRALFVDRSRFESKSMQGGDVYFAGVGHDDTRRVLLGIPGKLSYSSPVLRPQLGSTQPASPLP
jgi:hypothetical protein